MKRSSFAETRSDFEWDYDSRNLPTNSSVAKNESPADPFSNDLEQCNYDRRELRRRLSLDSDQEDELNSQFAMRVKRSNLRERLQQRMNLQICFVDNEAEDDDEDSNGDLLTIHDQDISIDEHNIDSLGNISNSSVKVNDSLNSIQSSHQQKNTTQKSISSQNSSQPNSNGVSDLSKNKEQEKTQVSSHTSSLLDSSNKLLSKFKPLFTLSPFSNLNFTQVKNPSINSGNGISDLHFDTFEEYHRHIHNEAKKALKSAKEMAQMQMQLEKDQSKANKILGIKVDKKSSFANLKKDSSQLSKMSISQLKHLIDQINAKATELNVTLVKLLEERDELNMEQDSLLIDIEDLTRFFLSQNR